MGVVGLGLSESGEVHKLGVVSRICLGPEVFLCWSLVLILLTANFFSPTSQCSTTTLTSSHHLNRPPSPNLHSILPRQLLSVTTFASSRIS